eukprot:TRINITY_DN7850_c0_g1_i13.p1 TRINITY_DN7850_c0_g1~~TRINITY_DN7850_c0_g1_i13.p1  ORF type:complete len:140 (-),score=13.70 TRINITY_DN7850_c0_g1_i13:133-552(-)
MTDLQKKNSRLNNEHSMIAESMQRLQSRMADLVEAFTKQDENNLTKLLHQIYREQITTLTEENFNLRKKNKSLREELECSICMSQEANCLLRPCGHSLCTECYYQIQRNWAQLNRGSTGGPPCPFCRQTISDLMPKFNS